MAVIALDPPFIYFHIYRTGGHAIRAAMRNWPVQLYTDVWGIHIAPADLKAAIKSGYFAESLGIEPSFWDKAFKFIFIRQPNRWYSSLYHYIRTVSCNPFHHYIVDLNFHEFLLWFFSTGRGMITVANPDMIFPKGIYLYHRLITQHDFVFDDDDGCLVDYIGTTENANRCFARISEILGLPKAKVEVVGKNPAAVHKYSFIGSKLIRTHDRESVKLYISAVRNQDGLLIRKTF